MIVRPSPAYIMHENNCLHTSSTPYMVSFWKWFRRCLVVLIAVKVLGATGAHEPVDLMADEAAWHFSPPHLENAAKGKVIPSSSQRIALQIESVAGMPGAAAWVCKLPALHQGERYRIEIGGRSEDIDHLDRHLYPVVVGAGLEYVELLRAPSSDGFAMSAEIVADRPEETLELRLYLLDGDGSRVIWNRATFTALGETGPKRTARVAAISGRPTQKVSRAEALQFYLGRMDALRGREIDLLCLPEYLNKDQVDLPSVEIAEPIPGPTTEALAQKARELGIYVAASLLERAGNKTYNTAVLIDREGRLVGRYRKAHLTVFESLVRGVSAGDTYPVFETDFGKVGLLVCYDNHYPEPVRALALRGADIIALPNASDSREQGMLWEPMARARAVDNHVHLVSAVNFGRSLIVNPKGEVLARNQRYTEEPGGLIVADLDLDTSVSNWSGRSLQKRYLRLRRPETYSMLAHSYGDFAEQPNAGLLLDEEIRSINAALAAITPDTVDTPLPKPVAERTVSSQAELQHAIAALPQGGRITVKAGVVLGDLKLRGEYPASSPLVIAAEEIGQVEINGAWTLSGQGFILQGLRWQGMGSRLGIQASHVRVTRCQFLDTGTPDAGPGDVISVIAQQGERFTNVRIDRCEIRRYYRDGIVVTPHGEIHDVLIDHNLIHHHFGTNTPRIKGCAIYPGTHGAHRNKWIGARVAYNYLEHMDGNSNVIHPKSSGGQYLFNHLVKSPAYETNIGVRLGRDNLIAGNYIEGGGVIHAKDYNTRILGNEAGEFRAFGGNAEFTFDTLRNKPETGYSTQPAARNTVMVGNRGTAVLGFHYPDYSESGKERMAARNTAIFAHQGDVLLTQREGFDWAGSWFDYRSSSAPSGLQVPEPIRLTKAEVGPFAP